MKEAQSTAKHQLRAYIGIPENDVRAFSPGRRFEVRLGIKNFGQTPAHSLRYWSYMAILDHPEASAFAAEKVFSGIVPINPDETFGVHCFSREVMSQSDIDALCTDKKRIHLIGEVHYRDTFERDRVTRFKFEFGGEFLVGLRRMAVSKEGNEAI